MCKQIKCSLVRGRFELNMSCLFQVNRVLLISPGWECGLECNFESWKASLQRKSFYVKWISGFIVAKYSMHPFIHMKWEKCRYEQVINFMSLHSPDSEAVMPLYKVINWSLLLYLTEKFKYKQILPPPPGTFNTLAHILGNPSNINWILFL